MSPSVTKMKKKKQQEEAKDVMVAPPPPDSTAALPLGSSPMGVVPAVEPPKKKKSKKNLASSSQAEDRAGGVRDTDDDVDGDKKNMVDTSAEEGGEKGQKQKKKKRKCSSEGEESTGVSAGADGDGDAGGETPIHRDEAAIAEGAPGASSHKAGEGNSTRNKKKSKLTDKWGKKLESEGAFEDDQVEDQGEGQSTPSGQEEVDPKKIMVGGMPYFITEDDIHEFFEDCGIIAKLDCMTFADTGKFKGIAFITFKTKEAAEKALALDGADMSGRFLKIEICKIKPKEPAKKEAYREPPKKHQGCLSAYVGNLAWDISEKELQKFFKNCRIDEIRLAVDKESGSFRGFGIIDFSDDQSLEAAIKLDQKLVLGRPIKVAYSVPKSTPNGGSRWQGQADKGNSKSCYTCGDGGHMSYSCPQKPRF